MNVVVVFPAIPHVMVDEVRSAASVFVAIAVTLKIWYVDVPEGESSHPIQEIVRVTPDMIFIGVTSEVELGKLNDPQVDEARVDEGVSVPPDNPKYAPTATLVAFLFESVPRSDDAVEDGREIFPASVELFELIPPV